MDDFEILGDLLKKEALASVENRSIILEERNSQSYALEITRIPDRTIAFRADMFPDPSRIFRNSRHECRRADYVIIACDDDRGWIVYVEMKKRGRGEGPGIRHQLRGAKCLVAYCRAIVAEFWGEAQFLEGYAERFVSVRNIGVSERPTRARRPRVHDAPEHVLRLSAPAGVLQFDKLLGAARR